MLARQLCVRSAQLTLCAGLFCACASDQGTVRRRGTAEYAGRHIPAQAYAWYSRGLYREGKRDLVRAEEAFSQALKYDKKSGAAWAALLRVRCKAGTDPLFHTLERGLTVALRQAPLYIERGWCRLKGESPSAGLLALSDGEIALDLEPDNRQATELIVQSLLTLGRYDDAERFAIAGQIRWSLPPPPPPAHQLADVDRALRAGDLPTARRLALTLVAPGHLALRAFAWNMPEIARKQAELVKGASPEDADATIALILLAPHRSLGSFPLNQPSDLGVLLMTNHLKRHFGRELAEHFRSSYRLEPHPVDPLLLLLDASLKSNPSAPATTVSF